MSVESRARADLRKKKRLERDLIRKLRVLNNKIVKDFILSYVNQGEIILATKFLEQYEAILLSHYETTGDQFNSDISKELPEPVTETDEERAEILAILLLFYNARAPRQAGIILTTTQRNINDSILEGIELALENVLPGQSASRREIARNAGLALKRKLNGRNSGISLTETQAVAEEAKQVEAEVLTPDEEVGPQKEWVTAGDSKVRTSPFSHRAADEQKRSLDDLFIVGGQKLKMPGDMSHGASIENVANCRCSSIVDTDELVDARMIRFDKDTQETVEIQIEVTKVAF